MNELSEIPAEQIASLKKQLKMANARLLSIERERQRSKDDFAKLADVLKRVELGVRTP